jgi:hypothetical protein
MALPMFFGLFVPGVSSGAPLLSSEVEIKHWTKDHELTKFVHKHPEFMDLRPCSTRGVLQNGALPMPPAPSEVIA